MFPLREAGAKLLGLQGAAADAETKSEELSGAVEELHKLLKEAGEGTYPAHHLTETLYFGSLMFT